MFQFFIFFGVQLGALYFAILILVEMPYLVNGVFCCLMSKKNTIFWVCSHFDVPISPNSAGKIQEVSCLARKYRGFPIDFEAFRLVISSYIQLYPYISWKPTGLKKLVNWNLHFPWNGYGSKLLHPHFLDTKDEQCSWVPTEFHGYPKPYPSSPVFIVGDV